MSNHRHTDWTEKISGQILTNRESELLKYVNRKSVCESCLFT